MNDDDALVESAAKAERELVRAGRQGPDWPEWDAPDPERGELKIDREFWRRLAREKIAAIRKGGVREDEAL